MTQETFPTDDEHLLAQENKQILENQMGESANLQPSQVNDLERAEGILNVIARVRKQSSSKNTDNIAQADTILEPSDNVDHGFSDEAIPRLDVTNLDKRTENETIRVGRFEIIDQIGRGGYGLVFLAYDPDLDRKVALKIPKPEAVMTDELVVRFIREGKAAAALSHPHIVAVFESGRAGPICYIASEFIHGQTLAGWQADYNNGIGMDAAAAIVAVLADAVMHAHQRGVLHRDLKPGNVILKTETGAVSKQSAGQSDQRLPIPFLPMITDFGLAKFVDHSDGQTTTSSIVGTPAYMSPEQARGGATEIGPATDIYALGVILYELITGRVPFESDSILSTLKAVQEREPKLPSRINQVVPIDLDAICLKCLEKSPDDRYATAADLHADLTRFINNEPVAARPPTTLQKTAKWCQRNPVLSSLIGMLTLLALMLIAGSTTAAVLFAQKNEEVLDALEKEIEAKDAATKSEDAALRALFEARVAQARYGRKSGLVGQRLDSIDALMKAAKQIPRLELGELEKLSLRNDAIACMRLVDIQHDINWPAELKFGLLDPSGARFAHWVSVDKENTAIDIRDVETGFLQSRHLYESRFVSMERQFSRDGRYIAVRLRNRKQRSHEHIRVWEIGQPEPVIVSGRIRQGEDGSISHDATRIAIPRHENKVEILALPSGELQQTLEFEDELGDVRFDPSGKRLAVRLEQTIEIINLETDDIELKIELSPSVHVLDWSPNGKLIAAAGQDSTAHVFETETGSLKYSFDQHGGAVRRVKFHPSGKFLATYSYDTKTRFWSLVDGSEIISFVGEIQGWSNDGSQIGVFNKGRARIVIPDEFVSSRLFWADNFELNRIHAAAIHPHGRLMVICNADIDQIAVWDLAKREQFSVVSCPGAFPVFSGDGKSLYVMTARTNESPERKMLRLPIVLTETDSELVFSLGPPRELELQMDHPAPQADSKPSYQIPQRHISEKVLETNNGKWTQFRGKKVSQRIRAITPCGRFLAEGSWHGPNVNVSDLTTKELVKTIRSKGASVGFSPDGKTLAVSEPHRLSIYAVDGWRLVRDTGFEAGRNPRQIRFSPDGSIIAWEGYSRNTIRLLDAATLKDLATLEIPADEVAQGFRFSPDGTQLIRASRNAVRFWDLRRIRQSLGPLDWDLPDYPKPRWDLSKSLRVSFDSTGVEKLSPNDDANEQ